MVKDSSSREKTLAGGDSRERLQLPLQELFPAAFLCQSLSVPCVAAHHSMGGSLLHVATHALLATTSDVQCRQIPRYISVTLKGLRRA